MKRWFKWLFLLLAVLLCIGGGLFLWQSGFFAAAGSQESLRAYIENFSPYSHLCFFLIQFLSVILAPIPSNVSALAGGVLFGTWVSFLLTFSAALASACGGSSGPVLSDFTTEIYTPAYASGFDIRGNGNNASTLVSIRNPWQGGTNVEQHLLILRDDA